MNKKVQNFKNENKNYQFNFNFIDSENLDNLNNLDKNQSQTTSKNLLDRNARHIYKVSEINSIIKETLEKDFLSIWIEGEISNSKLNFSGHFYFTLKDNLGQIKAVMFNSLYSYLKFIPKDGMEVIVKGSLSCFIKGGTYQINVLYMEPKGKGALLIAFEELKKRLEKEGLFDKTHKKPIPNFVNKIGVVTSPTGAAIKDILTVLDRRFSNLHIIIYPSKVQGEDAKFEIKKGIEFFNSWAEKVDVILVGRGGGSIEDLWAFNEEMVARAIYNSKIPIISCVGHEIDYLISDFVADLRAPTPSAAAEMLIKEKQELLNNIDYLSNSINNLMDNILKINFLKYDRLNFFNIIKLFDKFFNNLCQNFDYFSSEFFENFDTIFNKKIVDYEIKINKLLSLDPKKILALGYSVIKDKNGNFAEAKDLLIGEEIEVCTKNYILFCRLISKEKIYK